jgi:hypothetical protein
MDPKPRIIVPFGNRIMKKQYAITVSCLVLLASTCLNSPLASSASSPSSSRLSGTEQNKNSKKEAQEKKKADEARIRAARALCSAIDTLINAGRNGYEFLKGSRNYDKSGDKWIAYDASTVLPGANDCTVYVDRYTGRDSYVACTGVRTIESGDQEAAIKQWQLEVIAAIQPCLPRNWTKIDDRRQHLPGYFLMGEGDPGPKLEIDIARGKTDKVVELKMNFYPK